MEASIGRKNLCEVVSKPVNRGAKEAPSIPGSTGLATHVDGEPYETFVHFLIETADVMGRGDIHTVGHSHT